MRKLTYTNLVNGLSAEFSSESKTMHLDLKNFDGCSAGASAVTYRPVEFDGQRTISANLTARTIVVPVQFTGTENGKHSRKAALAVWGKLLKVFVPLHDGWLVWSDGTNSRRIKCRLSETPQISEVLPFLFSASFSLVADFPYWDDCSETSLEVSASASTVTVTNSCGLEVPFCVDIPSGGSQPLIYSRTADKRISFAISPGSGCTVDTRECTVTLSDGTLANNLLTVDSEFFRLSPGANEIQVLGVGSGSNPAVIRWRNLYMGVN